MRLLRRKVRQGGDSVPAPDLVYFYYIKAGSFFYIVLLVNKVKDLLSTSTSSPRTIHRTSRASSRASSASRPLPRPSSSSPSRADGKIGNNNMGGTSTRTRSVNSRVFPVLPGELQQTRPSCAAKGIQPAVDASRHRSVFHYHQQQQKDYSNYIDNINQRKGGARLGREKDCHGTQDHGGLHLVMTFLMHFHS